MTRLTIAIAPLVALTTREALKYGCWRRADRGFLTPPLRTARESGTHSPDSRGAGRSRTRRELFLAEMNAVIPWAELRARIPAD
jgi:hypothetical protein